MSSGHSNRQKQAIRRPVGTANRLDPIFQQFIERIIENPELLDNPVIRWILKIILKRAGSDVIEYVLREEIIAMSFDGVDDRIKLTDLNFNLKNIETIEARLNIQRGDAPYRNTGYLFSIYDGEGGYVIGCRIGIGHNFANWTVEYLDSDEELIEISGPEIPLEEWMTMTLRFRDDEIAIELNGDQVTGDFSKNRDEISVLYVGSRDFDGYFYGKLDHIKIRDSNEELFVGEFPVESERSAKGNVQYVAGVGQVEHTVPRSIDQFLKDLISS